MYIENQNNDNMIDLLLKKFPNSSSSETKIKYFNNTEDEYNALKLGIGVVISFNKTIIKLIGNDTLEFLHRISTNSVKELKPMHKVQTLFLNEKGRFIDRTDLLNLNDFYLLIGTCNHNRLFNWINKYIITEDIYTNNVSNDFVLIDFIGPQSESFLTLLLGDEIKSLNGNNILTPIVDGFNFSLFTHHDNNGLKYFRILFPLEKLLDFIDYLTDNKSVFDFSFVGWDAYEIFRIENGIPDFPNEINDEINPHENNLINEVSFNKGCYIGQEVVARLDAYEKVQWNMIGFVFDEYFNTVLPATIFNELKEEVGEVTSLANIPFANKTIGLGFIRKRKLVSNEKLFIEVNSKQIYLSLKEFLVSK